MECGTIMKVMPSDQFDGMESTPTHIGEAQSMDNENGYHPNPMILADICISCVLSTLQDVMVLAENRKARIIVLPKLAIFFAE
jgi:hypothetical protein